MSPRSVVIAAVTGLICGVTAMVVLGVALTLITGAVALPQATAAGLAGLAGALALVWRQSRESTGGIPAWAIAATAVFLVLMTASFAAPFGLPLGTVTVWQGLALVTFIGGVTAALRLCLRDARLEAMSRYEREVIYIRVLKGIGFVVFTIIVALPFYVMVMTSLKKPAGAACKSAGSFDRRLAGAGRPVALLQGALYPIQFRPLPAGFRLCFDCDRAADAAVLRAGRIRGRPAAVSGPGFPVALGAADLHGPGDRPGDPALRGLFRNSACATR
ncbi:hypothetical protein QW131_19275 [Roseibium salinum]|nr:hypothetical protein [Roseibium salinum]